MALNEYFNQDWEISSDVVIDSGMIITGTLKTTVLDRSMFDLRYEGPEKIIQHFNKVFEDRSYRDCRLLGNPRYSEDWNSNDWKTWVVDICDFSVGWPSLTFIIRRAGKEPTDLEMAWIKDGKIWSKKATITFEAPPEDYFE